MSNDNNLSYELNENIFDTQREKLPIFSKKQKLALKFLKTRIKHIKLLRKILYNYLNFPKTLEFSDKMQCKSNLFVFGSNVSLNDTKIINYSKIYIGNNVGFSFENLLLTSTHDISDFSIVKSKSIVIEDNVWITSRVIILGGVRIGKNSIIGAGSVVTKNIPANVFAAGNPCRVIRKIDRENSENESFNQNK
jgi:maltose O-acetyltransferase